MNISLVLTLLAMIVAMVGQIQSDDIIAQQYSTVS